MPDDIRSIARQMVEDYGHDPHGLLAGAICGAIYVERERCAGLMEQYHGGYELAHAIRRSPERGKVEA